MLKIINNNNNRNNLKNEKFFILNLIIFSFLNVIFLHLSVIKKIQFLKTLLLINSMHPNYYFNIFCKK